MGLLSCAAVPVVRHPAECGADRARLVECLSLCEQVAVLGGDYAECAVNACAEYAQAVIDNRCPVHRPMPTYDPPDPDRIL